MASSKRKTDKPDMATKDLRQQGHERRLGKKAGRLGLGDGAHEGEHEFINRFPHPTGQVKVHLSM